MQLLNECFVVRNVAKPDVGSLGESVSFQISKIAHIYLYASIRSGPDGSPVHKWGRALITYVVNKYERRSVITGGWVVQDVFYKTTEISGKNSKIESY